MSNENAKPYTMGDSPAFTGDERGEFATRFRATVAALEEARARVVELEGRTVSVRATEREKAAEAKAERLEEALRELVRGVEELIVGGCTTEADMAAELGPARAALEAKP